MAKNKAETTNAMRRLAAAGIPFDTASYPVDETDLSGVHAAEMLGIADPGCMFKTLVTRGAHGGHFVFCIPVEKELDLKRCAAAAGEKSVEMIPVKDMLAVTGYMRGGCSPIGMKKPYPTFLDESAVLFEKIYVSAGQRGMQLILSPHDLIAFVGATLAALTRA